jgi:outer membrane receptor protein involved in Fe transport
VNYICGVTDVRVSPPIDVGSMTTLDLATRYKVGMGIELDLSIQNVFDAQPSAISKTRTDEHPFDSTNYTPFGRFISIGVTKKW